jgi:hypothetical protein
MVEIGIHSCLILDVRKEMNGCDINLDQTELAHFVGQVFNEGNGVASKVEMDLRGIQELGTMRSQVDGPADMVLALMPPIKQSKKLLKLKTWSGAPVILGILGKEAV